MQYKTQIFSFDIELYNSRIHVFHNCHPDEITALVSKVFPDSEYLRPQGCVATAFTMVNSEGSEQYCIDFVEKLRVREPLSHKAIAHEASHTTCEISNDIGLQPGYANQESFAYLLGYIVKKINEEVFKKRRNGETI